MNVHEFIKRKFSLFLQGINGKVNALRDIFYICRQTT